VFIIFVWNTVDAVKNNDFPQNLDITLFPGDRHKQRLVYLVSGLYESVVLYSLFDQQLV
jgi:hypothetical protein